MRKAQLAAHRLGPPDQVVGVSLCFNRHEIGHFRNPTGREKPREKHICIREIHLLAALSPEDGRELKAAALSIIEQGRENRRRIEVRKAHEIDRPVHPDQSNRLQVSYHSIVFDRFVRHGGKCAGLKRTTALYLKRRGRCKNVKTAKIRDAFGFGVSERKCFPGTSGRGQ